MRYLALATDFDNTLASQGRVSGAARTALGRLRASGRRAILVSGRRLEDLLRACECSDLFDYMVAENGAPEPISATANRALVPPMSAASARLPCSAFTVSIDVPSYDCLRPQRFEPRRERRYETCAQIRHELPGRRVSGSTLGSGLRGRYRIFARRTGAGRRNG